MLCPFCKETIKDGAIKCKHCGSMIGSGLSTGQPIISSSQDLPLQTKFSLLQNEHIIIDGVMRVQSKVKVNNYQYKPTNMPLA